MVPDGFHGAEFDPEAEKLTSTELTSFYIWACQAIQSGKTQHDDDDDDDEKTSPTQTPMEY